MTVKPFSKQNFATRNYNVINSLPTATYSLSSLAASYNEGDTITITITTGFIVDGTVLYWTTTGTTTGADFSDGVTSGSVTITNNTGTVTRTVLSDLTTEGTETFVFNLLTGSTSGTIVASTSSTNILDTSISPLNYSVMFNGSSQYLVLPLNSGFAIGTGDFTVEAWVYPRTLQYWGTIIAGVNFGSGSDWGFYTGDGTSRYPFFQMTNSGTDTILATSFIPLNTWSHLAVTRSSGTVRIFINGILSNSGTFATQSLNNSYQKGIGGGYTGNGNTLLNGYISNLRVVKGTAVYTANFTPPTTALTAITNTSLLTCKGGTIADASTNALTITNNGTALVSGENPFGNYSMSFNGSQYLTVPSNAAFAFGTGDFTVEFWVYPTVDARQDWFDLNSGGNRLLIFYYPPNIVYFTNNDFRITGASMTLNSWQHIAVSRVSGSTKLFINGTQSGSTYTDTTNYISEPLSIGKDASGSTYITGYISNLRVVKGTAVYTANFTPPTSPLTAISGTSLLTCQYAELFDASTNNFTITNTGATPAITANPFDNYAYAFNGSSQYLTAPSNAAFAFGTGDFTIETWVYPNGSNYNLGIFHLASSSYLPSNASGLAVAFYGTNLFNVYSDTGGGTNVTATYNTNAWIHIALVRSSSVLKLYVNGIGYVVKASDTVNYTANYLAIGGYYGTSNLMTGYISNFRVVKGTAVYTATFTPPTSPLTAISGTSLLTCQYAELFDASTNNFTITNTGTAPAVATNLFAAPNNLKNYSGKFNGSSQYITVPTNASWTFTGTFTIEGWFQWTSTPVAGAFFGYQASGGLLLYINATSLTLSPNVFGTGNVFTTSFVPSINTWYHIALTRNSSNVMTLYVNGVSVGTATTSAAYTQGALSIGKFAGYISNIRLTNTNVYTGAFTPSATPLLPVSGTSLLTLQSNRIYDAGPNQLTITNNGSTTMSYLSPFST